MVFCLQIKNNLYLSTCNRRVMEHGLYMKHCKVEVYLLELKLSMYKSNEVITRQFSRVSTVGNLWTEC